MSRRMTREEEEGNLDAEFQAIQNHPLHRIWFINNGENARRLALLQADDRFAVEISPDRRQVFVEILKV